MSDEEYYEEEEGEEEYEEEEYEEEEEEEEKTIPDEYVSMSTSYSVEHLPLARAQTTNICPYFRRKSVRSAMSEWVFGIVIGTTIWHMICTDSQFPFFTHCQLLIHPYPYDFIHKY